MTRNRLIGVVVAALAGVLVLVFWPRAEPTPTVLIERMVVKMARAAEEKDVAEVMEHISERFAGTGGRALTKDELRRYLAAQMFRGAWVKVFVVNMDVEELSPTEANFVGTFIFGRSQADTLEQLAAQTQLDHYRVEGRVEKEEDGEWRFVTGSYSVVRPSIP